MEFETTFIIIVFVWLTFLTAFLVWFVWIFKNLIKDSKDKDFVKVFSNILKVQEVNTKNMATLKKDFDTFVAGSVNHVQKIGLVKYNPFSETGGEHSFSLALLDGKKNGIIITSLHSRVNTRVYLKAVEKGKGKIELSDEEKKTLKDALS